MTHPLEDLSLSRTFDGLVPNTNYSVKVRGCSCVLPVNVQSEGWRAVRRLVQVQARSDSQTDSEWSPPLFVLTVGQPFLIEPVIIVMVRAGPVAVFGSFGGGPRQANDGVHAGELNGSPRRIQQQRSFATGESRSPVPLREFDMEQQTGGAHDGGCCLQYLRHSLF